MPSRLSFAAAAVGALLLFPGLSAAQSVDAAFEAAFEVAVAEAGFPDLPDFSSAAADAGFGDIEEQRDALLAALEEEIGEAERVLDEALDDAQTNFEKVLAELLARRDELAATEPGPGDFVLENKPGGVIDCTNGVCVSPAD